MPADPEDLLAEVRELIAREVSAGFSTDEEIREQIVDMVSEEGDPDDELLDRIDGLIEKAVTGRAGEQEAWTGLTDCDRLDAAFAELQASGIVCRQNWTCCQSCGLAEIGGELGRASRGYVFFHQQDTEGAVETGSLFLAYGACSDVEAEQLALAHEIARNLRENGLEVEWDGDLGRRIIVKMEWKKRR
ncbi:MAG: hypothetical protein ACAI25_06800 [Planctomycetota bacterium]